MMRTTLGQICSIESVLVDPREREYRDLPHIGAANIVSREGRITDFRSVSEDGQRSGKFLFSADDILYSKIRPYLRKVARPGFNGLCSADVYPLRPRTDLVEPAYLLYLLLSDHFTDYTSKGSQRAQMPKVNRKHLFGFEFDLPHLDEQRRIVGRIREALEKVDELRKLREETTAAAGSLTQSARYQAFNIDAPIASLGPIIASGPTNGLYKHSRFYGDGTAILRINNFDCGDMLRSSENLRRLQVTPAEAHKFGLTVGDIVINRVNGSLDVLGKACLIDAVTEPIVFESNMMKFRADGTKVNPRYLVHFLASPQCREQIKAKARVIQQASINQKDVKSFELPLPTLDEQRVVVEHLDAFAGRVRSVTRELRDATANLAALSGAILRKAFAGEF